MSSVPGEFRLLDDSLLRREHEILGFVETPRLDHRAHLLVLTERQEVLDRATLRLARAERQLVHLQAIYLPYVREEQDVVVRRRDEEMLDVVVVLELELALGRDDLRAPVVVLPVDRLDLLQNLADHRVDPGLVAEDLAQLCDSLLLVAILVLDRLP